jgi:mono/diheme cytochrome c family protein
MRVLMVQATCGLIALSLNGLAPAAPPPPAGQNGTAFFEQHVRPLLVEHCYQCHSQQAKKVRGGLLLDSKAGWKKGGDNGPALVPGDPEKSLLIKAIRYGEELQMPPKGKLPDQQIDLLVEWVKMGAPDPREGVTTPTARKPIDLEQGRKYWAFQPLHSVSPPLVRNEAWCRTPIDRFILAKLEEKGLTANPSVDRRKLIRRASFDLTGLPPTPGEIDAFLNDPSPDAYAKMIDRLLASPHYGERWARHWLDVARFAESHGYEQDYDRPNAYHYRDFVIKAFNQDLPYDTFVKWQIAGDEFEAGNLLALTATGFLAAGTHATQITANQAEKERYDELDDMARTIGTTMLGLTIGCARCHDHKFDPVPTNDYYRLISTFSTTVRSDYEFNLDPEGYKRAKAVFDKTHAPLVAALEKFEREELPKRFEQWLKARTLQAHKGQPVPKPVSDLLTKLDADPKIKLTDEQQSVVLKWYRTQDPEWRKLNDSVQANAKKAPKPNSIKMLISSEGVPAVRLHTQGLDFYDPVYFLKRGDPNQKDVAAKQGFLQVLMRSPQQEKQWQVTPPAGCRTSYRRRSLANWITDVEQGAGHLLARVIVNRIWQHHLGRGIVATPSDFGKQGERPTHPELLDWLAAELIRNGWHLKPIHKLILTSAAYMQSGDTDEKRAQIDRENTLFWRHPAQRLEAEVIRDAMLAVSGTLDAKMYGPGTLDPNHTRRSLYFFVKRSRLVPMMTLFDAPDSLQDIADRPTTTIAPQALLMMNSAIIRRYAMNFARRIKPTIAASLPDAVRDGYRLALGRSPNPSELADCLAFVQQQIESYQADGKPDATDLALGDFCQTLMSLNEFIYID